MSHNATVILLVSVAMGALYMVVVVMAWTIWMNERIDELLSHNEWKRAEAASIDFEPSIRHLMPWHILSCFIRYRRKTEKRK